MDSIFLAILCMFLPQGRGTGTLPSAAQQSSCGFACDSTAEYRITRRVDAAGNATITIRVKKQGASDRVVTRTETSRAAVQATFSDGTTYCIQLNSGAAAWGYVLDCADTDASCSPCP